MAKFYQVSDNYFIDESFRLISKVNLPFGSKNQYIYVAPYLDLQNNEIIGFNLSKGANDNTRHYEHSNYIPLRNVKLNYITRFNDLFAEFYIPSEKKKHKLQIGLGTGVPNEMYSVIFTVFTLDGRCHQDVSYCRAENFTKITGLRSLPYNYIRIKRSNRENSVFYLSEGLNNKNFDLKYKGESLNTSRKIFFIGTCGLLLDDNLNLTGIAVFSSYNNNSVDISKFIYLVDNTIGRNVLLRMRLCIL